MQEIELLEYCEDVQHFEAHGHATCQAYEMATALASDMLQHLEQVLCSSVSQGRQAVSDGTKNQEVVEAYCLMRVIHGQSCHEVPS